MRLRFSPLLLLLWSAFSQAGISLIANNSVTSTSSTSTLTITHGFTLVNNDVIIALGMHTSTGVAFSSPLPSGMTDSGAGKKTTSAASHVIYSWVVDDDTNTVISVNSDSASLWSWHVWQLRGVDSTVWDVAPATANFTDHGSGSGTTTSSTISTNFAGSYAIAFFAADGNVSNNWSNYTQSYANETETGGASFGRSVASVGKLLGVATSGTGPAGDSDTTFVRGSWHFALKAASPALLLRRRR